MQTIYEIFIQLLCRAQETLSVRGVIENYGIYCVRFDGVDLYSNVTEIIY